jgi:glyoxalase family protein
MKETNRSVEIASGRTIIGIHHITAICGHPQTNIDFYCGVLGLRLVKFTVNYDDPGTYHLYYGNGTGQPGTILTFFPWPSAPLGRIGAGQVTTISFSVPEGSLEFWIDRLRSNGVLCSQISNGISFADPDGLRLELVAGKDDREAWAGGPIAARFAIRGFSSATITENRSEATISLLSETMGFRKVGQQGNRTKFEIEDGGASKVVYVEEKPDEKTGRVSRGTVHHIAWRTPTDQMQSSWRKEIESVGLNVTPIIDRTYFHSIYYREQGGVLFEIATDPPGFDVDEPLDKLGTSLKLPARLEPLRLRLEQHLPPVTLPSKSDKLIEQRQQA